MRQQSLKPGDYVFPRPDSVKELSSPEMVERYNQGPNGLLTVLPNGLPAMGRSLGIWFAYATFVSAAAGYVATFTLAPGADSMLIFRVTGTVAILVYALGHIPNSIWKGASWMTSFKFVVDGVVYGLATGAVFAWLWPS